MSVLLADSDIGAGIMAAAFFGLIAAYWRHAQMEADLKRAMVEKGLSADEIERVLRAGGPPAE